MPARGIPPPGVGVPVPVRRATILAIPHPEPAVGDRLPDRGDAVPASCQRVPAFCGLEAAGSLPHERNCFRSSAYQSSPPLLRLGEVLFAISDKTRWRILQKLSAAGEPLMVTEIAEAIGRKPSAAAKHLAILRKAGITRIGRGRLQQIVPQFLTDPSARVLDLGYLQVRLGIEERDSGGTEWRDERSLPAAVGLVHRLAAASPSEFAAQARA